MHDQLTALLSHVTEATSRVRPSCVFDASHALHARVMRLRQHSHNCIETLFSVFCIVHSCSRARAAVGRDRDSLCRSRAGNSYADA